MSKNKLIASEAESEETLHDPEAEAEAAPSPAKLPEPAGDEVPDWVVLPAQMKAPRGRQVVFLRFPPALTAAPEKGERQCIVWSLSDGEEKLANDRTNGSSARAPSEFTKQMIRAVDGVMVDWSKARGPGSLDEFWREVGPKGRNLLMRIYTQLHLASEEETRDFFEHCVAVRTVGLGTLTMARPPTPTWCARSSGDSPA